MDTKSRAGRRVIGAPAQLMAWLTTHQKAQEEERELAADMWHDGGWVFAQPTGTPTDPRADYGEWCDLLQEAGVRPARLHDARHTAATMLLVLKVPTRAVMNVMGWSQVNMTSRYQHVPAEVLTGIADQVGGLLWAPRSVISSEESCVESSGADSHDERHHRELPSGSGRPDQEGGT